ncbi:MAG: hypothetical protein CMM56_08105 [Rhodospirillaceae bacterium]|nr:hypothetical protein [Rhodospirillaceae bacterium]|tara:strand:- start:1205 stop:1816 length:612 start_codon:yes stop_codon:yes gene_type:complete
MDQSLKERLVGALVLVSLAVLFAPMILNGPVSTMDTVSSVNTDSTVDLALPAPQNNTDVRTQIVNLEEDQETLILEPGNGFVIDNNQGATSVSVEASPIYEVLDNDQDRFQEESDSETLNDMGVFEEDMWVVQVGSFREEENAQRQAERIATFGFDANVSSFATSDRTMFRVRIGPESSRADAEAIASSLGTHGFVAQVVSQD